MRGVCQVARTLRLDYYDLKRRMADVAKKHTATPPAFVEVKLEAAGGRLAETLNPGVIELWDGARHLRLHAGERTEIWLALAESFWKEGR